MTILLWVSGMKPPADGKTCRRNDNDHDENDAETNSETEVAQVRFSHAATIPCAATSRTRALAWRIVFLTGADIRILNILPCSFDCPSWLNITRPFQLPCLPSGRSRSTDQVWPASSDQVSIMRGLYSGAAVSVPLPTPSSASTMTLS